MGSKLWRLQVAHSVPCWSKFAGYFIISASPKSERNGWLGNYGFGTLERRIMRLIVEFVENVRLEMFYIILGIYTTCFSCGEHARFIRVARTCCSCLYSLSPPDWTGYAPSILSSCPWSLCLVWFKRAKTWILQSVLPLLLEIFEIIRAVDDCRMRDSPQLLSENGRKRLHSIGCLYLTF